MQNLLDRYRLQLQSQNISTKEVERRLFITFQLVLIKTIKDLKSDFDSQDLEEFAQRLAKAAMKDKVSLNKALRDSKNSLASAFKTCLKKNFTPFF